MAWHRIALREARAPPPSHISSHSVAHVDTCVVEVVDERGGTHPLGEEEERWDMANCSGPPFVRLGGDADDGDTVLVWGPLL